MPNLTHLSDQNKSWDPIGCFPAVFGRSMAIIMRPLIRSRRPVPHGTVLQSGLQACIIVECSKFQKTHSESRQASVIRWDGNCLENISFCVFK